LRKRDLDYKIVGLAILFLLCWMGFYPLACRGAVVWSDDFNDGNYDGWTICDNSTLDDGDWGWSGSNWTAADGYLQIEAGYGDAGWGIISHPSNVAYGTWSFDFKTNWAQGRPGNIANFEFMGGNFYDWDDWEDGSGYWINLATVATAEGYDMRFRLGKAVSTNVTFIDSSEPVPILGWHHIEITRTTGGLFSVYHNGSLILQGADTDIGTSEMFWLWFAYESMIDNIVVDDAPPIDWLPIAIIGASAVVIIAVVVIILRRR
jgi:hypothetical protein